MRVSLLGIVVCLIVSCGASEKEVEKNPTNCSVKEVAEGIEFRCTDKNGVESSGVVKNGKQGEKGSVGEKGEPGKGLALVNAIECKGSIEGWLENTSYAIEFHQSEFETGDTFLSSSTKLFRGTELVNERQASAFFLSGPKSLHDGIFSMLYTAQGLEVVSQGGIKALVPCKEVK